MRLIARMIVGEEAERCFTPDFSNSLGEKPSAGGHSFYGSEGVFSSISAQADEGQIGLKTGIHSFPRLLMQMAADKATLCGGASRLERATGTIARRTTADNRALTNLD